MTPAAPVPRLEPAFDVTATLGPLEDHGATRAGHRRVVPITGGLVSGLAGGLADAEILDALLRGEPVDPSEYYFRVSVYLETSAPRLAELQRSIFVAAAIRGADSVRYTAYRVT